MNLNNLLPYLKVSEKLIITLNLSAITIIKQIKNNVIVKILLMFCKILLIIVKHGILQGHHK